MTVRSSHLVKLKSICQLVDQRANLVRLFCNSYVFGGYLVLILYYCFSYVIQKSSAYGLTEDFISH